MMEDGRWYEDNAFEDLTIMEKDLTIMEKDESWSTLRDATLFEKALVRLTGINQSLLFSEGME